MAASAIFDGSTSAIIQQPPLLQDHYSSILKK